MQCNYYQYWGGWKASRRASLNGSWKGPSLTIMLIIERLHDKVAADDEKKCGGTLVWAAGWAKNRYSAFGCGGVFQKRLDLVRITLLPRRFIGAHYNWTV